ncbi:MAG: LysM domain-containing protein [Vulcanococcus sp.]|uniref:LysM peptidoglycan-binding domain-containing protein n=1 Tax=Vulcanococcus sp. TaxID=2856995 RepID=UPI0025FC4154|nr:LysM domain-containing protein [Vulcanococcus sp.]MBW0166368.1 LysM domain-containing protein [Vulcanococcus sp.]
MQRRHRVLALASALVLIGSTPAWGQTRTITVVEGDTLEQLALRYRVDLQALIDLNGIRDPTLLQVGEVLKLPEAPGATKRSSAPAEAMAPPPPEGSSAEAAAALLLSPAERRDRAELEWRERSGLARWKWFNSTAVDWSGWRLHPGGVRITLVKPSISDLGLRGSAATAVAVQCTSLRQNWRIDGTWQGWDTPAPGTVGQRIVLDLCSNTLDGPAVPLPPPPS